MVAKATKCVFLSAGIPKVEEARFAETADPLLIHSAVRSLCAVVFGNLRLVWGGHPAITPMMWAACENLGLRHAQTVRLYQSRYFEDAYPKENKRFRNITYTAAADTQAESLHRMRREMLTRHRFVAGIFVGGAGGVLEEFAMFRNLQPHARVIVLPSTGGAAGILAAEHPELAPAGEHFVHFHAHFAEHLGLTPRGGDGRASRRG